MLNRKITFENRTWTLCTSRAIHGHSGAEHFSRNCSPDRSSSQAVRKSSSISATQSMKKPSKRKGSYKAASSVTKIHKQCTSRSSAPWRKTRTNSAPPTNTSSLSTTRSTLWTWNSRKRRKSSNKIRERAESQSQDSRFHCTHTSKRMPVATPWSMKTKTLHAKVHDKDTLPEETLCATEVPHQKVVAHFTTKRKMARPDTDVSSFWSGRNQTPIDILQLTHTWCDDQALDRVMTAPRFGRGAMARSFDHSRSQLETSNTRRAKITEHWTLCFV